MERVSADWLGIGTECGEGQYGLVGNMDCMWEGAVWIGWETGLYLGSVIGDCLGIGTAFGEGQWGMVGNRDCMWRGAMWIGWE